MTMMIGMNRAAMMPTTTFSTIHPATSRTSAASTVRPNDLPVVSFIASIRIDAPAPRTKGPAPGSDAQLLVHEPRHLASVGAALGVAHDLSDDRPDGLRVSFAHALRGVGVGLQRRRDDLGQLLAAVERGEPLCLDDLFRLAPLADERVEHLARGAHAEALGVQQTDEARHRGGSDAGARRILFLVQPR